MREYDRFEKGAANSQHVDGGAQAAARGPERADHHHHDPEARPLRRRPTRATRSTTGTSCSSSTSATARQFGDMHAAITQGVQAVPPVRLHRHADLRRRTPERRQPAAAHHRAGLRRQAAHLHDRRRDHRQERAAVPHRLRQHDQGRRPTSPTSRSRAIDTEQALLAPERIAPGRRLHPRALRPEDRRAASATASGTSASRGFNSLFATASIDAAKRYYEEFAAQQPSEAAGPGVPAAEDRHDLQLRRQRGRRGDGLLGDEEFETDALDAVVARLPRGGDRRLQRDVRHQLRHLVRPVPELLQGPVACG